MQMPHEELSTPHHLFSALWPVMRSLEEPALFLEKTECPSFFSCLSKLPLRLTPGRYGGCPMRSLLRHLHTAQIRGHDEHRSHRAELAPLLLTCSWFIIVYYYYYI